MHTPDLLPTRFTQYSTLIFFKLLCITHLPFSETTQENATRNNNRKIEIELNKEVVENYCKITKTSPFWNGVEVIYLLRSSRYQDIG